MRPKKPSEADKPFDSMDPVSAPKSMRPGLSALLDAMQATPSAGSGARAGEYLLTSPSGETRSIPPHQMSIIARVIEVLARGDGLIVMPNDKPLTTQQAANMLNVSRQYLVRLLDAGKIPHTKTGRHRRVKVKDLRAFQRKRDAQRKEGLRELSQLTQEFDGYPELEPSE